jgi:uncharacterized protein YraI
MVRLLFAMAGLALATALSVPSPARATMFCPILKSRDGFVALRAGPGTRYPVIARMKEGDEVLAVTDADRNGWMRVHHWWGLERHDDKTRTNYRKGFVHKRYVGDCG